ncbi:MULTISPECIES: MoaD/ThiS family protein [Oerskovia]|jgi:molybdopterin converting factor small subunit|uniref:MoaD/ThiS family protein n=1 Tax=Oerskovia merdavium TaxID=2762227 RepID=A0ABR8U177_9CELL|nr:MoaD/ThiS family protein [Oerskovia merdavium]MBD7981774.1 MoaD/ThiS family protein [Oerskovia merdavium]
MPAITLRYYAAARAAANGLDEEVIETESPAAALRASARRHGEAMRRVQVVSSYLQDGRALRPEAAALPVDEPVTIDVLPPFAGG